MIILFTTLIFSLSVIAAFIFYFNPQYNLDIIDPQRNIDISDSSVYQDIDEITNIILRGKNVANLANFNEKMLHLNYFRKMKKGFDVIVLGSSRSMYIRSKYFTNLSFHNFSVSTANLNHIISLYEGYYDKKGKPRILIIGLDHWFFQRDSLEPYLIPYYDKMRVKLHISNSQVKILPPKSLFMKLEEIFSFFSLQQSVTIFMKSFETRLIIGNYYATDRIVPTDDGQMLLNDGSLIFAKNYRNLTQKQVDLAAEAYKKPRFTGDDIDPDLYILFMAFLDYLNKDGVRVIIYLPPFHPVTKINMKNKNEYSGIDILEDRIREIAKKKNITIVGSYNPIVCGCGTDEFYDGHHAKDSCISKIFIPLQQILKPN